MPRTIAFVLASLVALSNGPALASPPETPPQVPYAPRLPKARTLHGETITDDYAWLRDLKKARAYLTAEADYAARLTSATKPLQKKIYDEIVSRTREDNISPPYRRGAYVYSMREQKGKEHPSWWRRPADGSAPDSVVLDEEAMSKGHAYFSIGHLEPSDDGRLLAYTTDEDGHEDYTLHVRDLERGRELGETIRRVSSLCWAADNKTLFYTVEDRSKRSYRAYRHVLGQKKDVLIFEEKDARFGLDVDRTTDGALVVLSSDSHTQTEVRFLPADRPTAPLVLVAPREPDHEYAIDHGRGTLYIRTNKGAPNGRLVTAPLATPGPEHWHEILAHRQDVMLESYQVFADYLVLCERDHGTPELRVIELPSLAQHRVALDETVRDVGLTLNYVFDSPTFRFLYSSPISPPAYYDYDPRTHAHTLVKREDVPGGYDPRRYEVTRVQARAPDGTAIPISLLSQKNQPRNGTAPLLLEAYGAYGLITDTGFDESIFSLVDRGFVIAWAHVRGGGELGKRWHDDGRMLNKRNTFTDFIAAARWLVDSHYTSASRLAIRGGSAGGLLMGAVVNLAPELFRVVVAEVPFVDVVNTMLDTSLPLTVGEFEEWGDPRKREHYTYLRSYCPYENVTKRAYPSMLVTSALNDARAPFWEAAKWVAKLRTCKTDENPLVFKIDLSPAGHSGPSGRYQQIDEEAYTYAFILSQLGYTE